MARTIGRKNIALVKRVTEQMLKRRTDKLVGSVDYSGLEDSIIEALPPSLWDIWEMADQEIRRIIDDTILDYQNRRG